MGYLGRRRELAWQFLFQTTRIRAAVFSFEIRDEDSPLLDELKREIDLFCELFAKPAVEAGLKKFVESRDAQPYLP